MGKNQDIYSEPKVFTYENCIVRVYSPVLTEEERERRMNALKKTTANFMKAVMKAEREKA